MSSAEAIFSASTAAAAAAADITATAAAAAEEVGGKRGKRIRRKAEGGGLARLPVTAEDSRSRLEEVQSKSTSGKRKFHCEII